LEHEPIFVQGARSGFTVLRHHETRRPARPRDDGVDVVRSAVHDRHEDMSGLVYRSPFQFFRRQLLLVPEDRVADIGDRQRPLLLTGLAAGVLDVGAGRPDGQILGREMLRARANYFEECAHRECKERGLTAIYGMQVASSSPHSWQPRGARRALLGCSHYRPHRNEARKKYRSFESSTSTGNGIGHTLLCAQQSRHDNSPISSSTSLPISRLHPTSCQSTRPRRARI
jgi:hypothetical protein